MRYPVYLEHAMAGSKSAMDAELENYERKDDLVQRLQGYVTNEVLAKQLEVYVPLATVDEHIGKLVRASVDKEIANDATKDQVGEIAETKMKDFMNQQFQDLSGQIEELRTQVETTSNRPKLMKKVMKKVKKKRMKKVMMKAMKKVMIQKTNE